MRVLVTRPEPDSEQLAVALRARGHEPALAPLMRIEPTSDVPPSNVGSAVLLFTSANGVRAAAMQGVRPVNGVLTVGPASAAAARASGFDVAAVAGGDVASLAEAVRTHVSLDRPLVHVAGADLAGDLSGELRRAGYCVTRWTAYRAVVADVLPDTAREFVNGGPGAVALFSPRSARLLINLMQEAGLAARAPAHLALCLSAAVAAAAVALPWRNVLCAPSPDQAALIDLLD